MILRSTASPKGLVTAGLILCWFSQVITGNILASCGNTTSVPYTPKGYAKQKLQAAPIKSQCQRSSSLGDRLLVTSTFTSDVEWMLRDIPIPVLVYYAGNDSTVHHHPNVANEALGYLTFIAEYYHCLPKVTLFAHPHKSSYHTLQDLDHALKNVHWEKITGNASYSTLHPLGAAWAEFNPWDPAGNLVGKNLSNSQFTECFYVLNGTVFEYWPRWEYQRAQWIAKAWDLFFGPAGLGEMPPKFRSATTAEFFVTRERIRLRPREFYLQAISWILQAEKQEDFNSWELGVVFELLWHYIFGQPAFMFGPLILPCELYRCKQTLAGIAVA